MDRSQLARRIVPLLALHLLAMLLLLATLPGAGTAQSDPEPEGTAWLGLYVRNVDRDDIEALDLDRDIRGVMVSGIDDEGPAAKAGVEPGDVVIQFDAEPVRDRAEFMRQLQAHAPGDRVKLVTVRAGKERTVTVVLGTRPEDSDDAVEFGGPAQADVLRQFGVGGPTLGVRTLDLDTDELAGYFGVQAGGGVLVTGLVEDGGAANAGIQPGDVIVAIEDRAVGSTADIRRQLQEHKQGDQVDVRFRRKNAEQTLAVELDAGMELSRLVMPVPDRGWRMGDDIGDLRRELEDLKRDVRRLERDLRRQR